MLQSPDTPEVRIIIPAYNEELRIGPTIEAYCSYFGSRATVSVILNGCTDRTIDVVREAMHRFPQLTVLDIPAPVGKGGAVRCGFMLGKEPFIGFVDADLSFAPSEFDKLLRRCQGGADAAIGSRWTKGAEITARRAPMRAVASNVFRAVRWALFRIHVCDTQCGLKVFRRQAIDAVIDDLEIANLAFDIDILIQLNRRQALIQEVPVTWFDASGGSVDILKTSVSMLIALMRLRLRRSALGNIPYIDWIARQSVMPVARKMSVLLLDVGCAPESVRCVVRSLKTKWGEHGIMVQQWPRRAVRSSLGQMFSRIRLLFWYTFGTARQYDAIVATRGGPSWILPFVSAKRSVVICDADDDVPGSADGEPPAVRNARFLSARDEVAIYDEVNANLVLSAVYGARFLILNDDPTLVYADRSGQRRYVSHLLSDS